MASRVVAALVAAFVALAATRPALGHDRLETEDTYIQGVFVPRFTPPAPGTYELPIIKSVPSFVLLRAGRAFRTDALMAQKIAVVSFIYTSCADGLGCPLASSAMRELQTMLLRDGLQKRVVLLSISFDPGSDTPARLATYARHFGADASIWQFLTASSEQKLQPILDSYGQDHVKIYDTRGRFTGRYRHVLKVFLVDQRARVRNIYSTGLLVPQLVLNDIRTVLGE